jgi:hypothetical protein
MKTLFKQNKRNALYLTAIACLMLAGSISGLRHSTRPGGTNYRGTVGDRFVRR